MSLSTMTHCESFVHKWNKGTVHSGENVQEFLQPVYLFGALMKDDTRACVSFLNAFVSRTYATLPLIYLQAVPLKIQINQLAAAVVAQQQNLLPCHVP